MMPTPPTKAMDRLRRARPAWRLPAIAVVVALVVLLIGYAIRNAGQGNLRVSSAQLTLATVHAAPFLDFVPLRGRVVPLRSVQLDVPHAGRVDRVFAQAGQHVTANQPLLRLADPALELEAIAQEAAIIHEINDQHQLALNLTSVLASDRRAVAEADYQVRNLGRVVEQRRAMFESGFQARLPLDQVQEELEWQRHNQAIATAAQARDQATIARSQTLIDSTSSRLAVDLAAVRSMVEVLVVRAPVEGTLTGLDAVVGQEMNRGQTLGQVDQDGGFKVTAEVNEYYLGRVAVGQRMVVTGGGPAAVLEVAKLYPQVRDGRFQIDLVWRGAAPAGLRRGETVQGRLELSEDVNTLQVDSGPFIETSQGSTVFVLEAGGATARRRTVRWGRRTPAAVEVVGGLAAGERVVVSAYSAYDRVDTLSITP